ncbi:MAG: transposase [Rhizobiales bacterium]|nr:transposase [Hyphomicrobiales bacterium]
MSVSYPKAQVLTEPKRRRLWSVPEKLEMVAQTREAGVTVSLVARRRAGSVDLDSFGAVAKRVFTLVMPPPGLAATG